MMVRLVLFALMLITPTLTNAQMTDWRLKVDDLLWEKVERGGKAEFLVILTEQADVSPAYVLGDKNARGQYVYEVLREVASRTQIPFRTLLENTGTPYKSFWIINGLWVYGDADLIKILASMPAIARVEDNPVISLDRPDPLPIAAQDRSLSPWGITKINAPAVWNMGYTGQGVVVGGQDTGYEWEHPAIVEKYRGWNGFSADHNYNWHDAIDSPINGGSNSCGLNRKSPCDDNGHGTHTMGTMVGTPDPDSMIGVAPGAQWIGCRNMEEGDGTPATYIECFEWFVAPTDTNHANANPNLAPHVINNSWSCPNSEGCNSGNYATMESVINNVRAAGIVVVVSAGNTGPGCSSINAPPAIYTGSFVVGATQSNDLIASFSSRGPVTVYGPSHRKPDVAAPGVGVASCVGTDNNPGTYGYASFSGTSMAGPHVAGAVALLISAKPALSGQVDEIESLLESTALDLFPSAPFCGNDNSGSTPNNVYGYGRINVPAAVNAALNLPVEWLYVRAEALKGSVHLQWATAVEVDCAYFEIQHSADGRHWSRIGQMPCKGAGEYEFSDNNAFPGWNYYRLRQVDLDGRYSMSPLATAKLESEAFSWRLFAVPSQSMMYVEFNQGSEVSPLLLEVYGLDGTLIHRAQVTQSGGLALPSLPHGIYAIVLRDTVGNISGVKKIWW